MLYPRLITVQIPEKQYRAFVQFQSVLNQINDDFNRDKERSQCSKLSSLNNMLISKPIKHQKVNWLNRTGSTIFGLNDVLYQVNYQTTIEFCNTAFAGLFPQDWFWYLIELQLKNTLLLLLLQYKTKATSKVYKQSFGSPFLYARLMSGGTLHITNSKISSTYDMNELDADNIYSEFDLLFNNEDFFKQSMMDILAICDSELLLDENITSPTLRILQPDDDDIEQIELKYEETDSSKVVLSTSVSILTDELSSSLESLNNFKGDEKNNYTQASSSNSSRSSITKRWLWRFSLHTGRRIMSSNKFKGIIRNGIHNMVRRSNAIDNNLCYKK